MTKDQTYGGLILLVSIVIAASYLIGFLFAPGISLLLVEIPVVLAVLAILGITAWIGWTMATTPPPAPLETELPSTTSAATTGSTSSQARTTEAEEK